MTNLEQAAPEQSRRPGRLLFAIPLALVVVVGGFFLWGLSAGGQDIPSALIDEPIPNFDLPPVQGRTLGLSDEDLQGHVSLVNVFASWCVPCRDEHPLFMALSESGEVPIYGVNYKDRPNDAEAWLDELGDPYARIGADLDGRVGVEWGVYGVPETFVISADGRIVHKHIGRLTQAMLDQEIMPLVRRLQAEAQEEASS